MAIFRVRGIPGCLFQMGTVTYFASQTPTGHGRPHEFFERGAKPCGLTKMTYFVGVPKARTKIFAIFRRSRLSLRVFDASAECASENFTVISTRTAYDVIIFKFQGGQLPQFAPPLPGVYATGDYSHQAVFRQL